MEKQKLKFPDGFLWGAATSAHQVEGGNKNDWSEWEKANAKRLAEEAPKKHADWQVKKFPEMLTPENYISGAACDYYNRFEEDFDIAKSLSHNAHRFSIEWSRIEPEEGKFDEQEIEHYRKVIKAVLARGMEPFVTIWHWTNPLWLAEKGGPENRKFAFYFARYAKFVVEKLGEDVKFWITLNEPTSVIAAAYSTGYWPPQKKNPIVALKVYKILAKAHNQAYREMKKINSDWKVGFSNILQYIEPNDEHNLLDKLSVKVTNYFSNQKFLNLVGSNQDFLAVQYYFHKKIKFPFKQTNENKTRTDMGWEIYPEGIYHLIKNLQKYNLPIYITENGLADVDDTKRDKFIKDHLKWTHKAISEGVDVRGYFHWSLLDNFEWDKGFWPRFGLVEIDYKTLERKIRPSAREYAKICQENMLKIEAENLDLT
ncbi:MAG: glycoside hydrolase family 1 protein [Candidatus Pacebacteria bacterium]|nr:glycoside hydrolase family 1 protein [Candidatus Paceibacterota bacterium]MDR3583542.1 glycoside hydrolase family 1 protein [Candidatus Paceibacterota bacterium]